MSLVGGSVFADLLRTLSPYLRELVFVGGWVQALYVLEVEGIDARVVRTSDIDLTLAPKLDRGHRPALLDLLREAGFEVQAFDDESGYAVSKSSIEVDLLAEGSALGAPVRIEGQPDLRVFGYPHQNLLRTNTRPMLVGSAVDDSLEPPIEILVPTLPAYVLGKLLSSAHRTVRSKQAKDLVYVSELMARAQLATLIVEGLPELVGSYLEEGRQAREWLVSALDTSSLIADAARQVIESSGFGIDDDTPVRAQVASRLRRLLEEGWA